MSNRSGGFARVGSLPRSITEGQASCSVFTKILIWILKISMGVGRTSAVNYQDKVEPKTLREMDKVFLQDVGLDVNPGLIHNARPKE